LTEPSILNLDDGRALDPAVVGAKAATLAAARRAGLPVLPGFAIGVGAAHPALAVAEEALQDGNSGRARLVLAGYQLPAQLQDQLDISAVGLGEHLVVRSSSPIEGEALWSGAFASYAQITADELHVAVRGCWASWFTEDALRRAAESGIRPGEIGMAVLVQSEIVPEFGGVARVDDAGAVVVTGIEGTPASIVSGWEQGHTAAVEADNAIVGEQARSHLGDEVILAAAGLARRVASLLDKDLIEWAQSGDTVWLLQAQRAAPRRSTPAPVPGTSDKRLIPLVRLIADYPGPIGDAFVIPWALGSVPDNSTEASVGEVAEMLSRARRLVEELVAAVWAVPTSYRETRLALQELDPAPGLALVEGLNAPDPDQAAEVLGLLAGIALELTRRGHLPAPEWIWHLSVDELTTMVETAAPRDASRRFPLGGWEPFLFSAIRALSPPVSAQPVVPGTGAGRLHLIRTADDAEAVEPRSIVAAVYPLNNLAPLLFDAAGLVTIGGSPGAHVFEVSASLGLPSMSGVDLEAVTGLSLAEIRGRRDLFAAIYGSAADISILALGEVR